MSIRLFFLRAALPFAMLVFYSQDFVCQTYNFSNFTVEEGLVQNQILSVCQDKRGNIWFGTNGGGISIYDGTKFDAETETEGLVNNVVYAIEEGKDGTMYIGTNGGLSIRSAGKYLNITTDSGLTHNRVFSVLEATNGDIWVGTSAGVCVLKNGKIELLDAVSELKDSPVFTVYEDRKQNIWFGTVNKGLFRWDGSRMQNFNIEQGLHHNFVRTILEDKAGLVWIGTAGGLCHINQAGVITKIRAAENESALTITSSALTSDGSIWFGTMVGLQQHKDGKIRRLSTENGLSSNNVWAILEDREGNLWIGTQGKGVSKLRLKGDPFVNYSAANGLQNEVIQCVKQSSDDAMWFGTLNGVIRMKDKKFEMFPKPNKSNVKLYYAANAYSIIQDKKGDLWFGTRSEDAAVVKYDGNQFKAYGKEDGFPDNVVNVVFEDRDGFLWFGTASGVVKQVGDKFVSIPDLGKDNVWGILQDNAGNMWFSTEKGILLSDGRSVQYFGEKDGAVDGRVRDIRMDRFGRFWMATNQGLLCYKNGNFRIIDKSTGISSNTVYSVIIDARDNLWIGTNRGIDKIDLKSYNETNQIKVKYFGKIEGFAGVECNQNAVTIDKQGKIWFGTVKGATVYDPSLEQDNNVEPLTSITSIRLDFTTFDWSNYSEGIDPSTALPINLTLPYDKNHLTFDFVGVSLSVPQKVQYQYILEPLEKDWGPPTSKNEAVYSYVPPGEYVFKVKAKNNDGLWNEQPVEFRFTVLVPWYSTWWFYACCMVAAGGVVFGYVKVRERNLRKTQQILEEQVRVRTAELREEKEKVEQINLEVLHKNEIIEEKNKDITDSINYAKKIQEAILPQPSDQKRMLPESFVLFRPKDIVCGDFFWMAEKGDLVLFTAADCTGHGVPGAFMSMINSALLNEVVNEKGITKPNLILDGVKSGIIRALKQGGDSGQKDGMDAALCGLHKDSGVLEFAGANNPLYLIRKKGHRLIDPDEKPIDLEPNQESETHELYEIKASKQPVGYYTDNDAPFENNVFKLEPGDAIYVASDGFADQFGGPKGKKFMYKSFKLLLLSICTKPAEEQKQILLDTILDWMGESYEQVDDICVIGVRV